MKRYFLRLYFSFQGRTGRLSYWLYYFVPFALLGGVAGHYHLVERRDPSIIPVLLVALFLAWPYFAVAAKRWHDCNQSGWWALLLVLPYINYLVLLIMGILPGTVGDNRYGADPQAPRAAL